MYMRQWQICIALLLIQYDRLIATRRWPNLQSNYYSQKGDVMFGASLDVHARHKTDICGIELRELAIIQRTEALAFAINELNANPNILPNISIGFSIVDSCSKDITARAKSLAFIQRSEDLPNTCSVADDTLDSLPAIGIFCAGSSRSTILISPVLALQNIPLLSFTSSSPLLSDKVKFPNFFRIVPPDTYQARAILSILIEFQWTYFSVLYEEGSYGNELYKELSKAEKNFEICQAIAMEVKPTATTDDYIYFVEQLASYPQARAVVLILQPFEAINILSVVKATGRGNDFFWIGTDSWAQNVDVFTDNGIDDLAIGIISTNFMSNDVPRFEEYFASLTSSTTNNPWLKDYVAALCPESENCNTIKMTEIQRDYKPLNYMSLIVDVVNVFARTVDNILKNSCDFQSKADKIQCLMSSNSFIANLKKTSFAGETGDVFFDDNQDGPSRYHIHNLKMINNTLQDVVIGSWDSELQRITFTLPVTFRLDLLQDGDNSPTSQCSKPCLPGFRRETGLIKCCWDCVQCKANEISVGANYTVACLQCPQASNYSWPNANKSSCIPIDQFIFTINHPAATIIVFLSALGLCLGMLTAYAFWFYRRHHLIKACSLKYLIWGKTCVLLANLVSLTFALKPDFSTCVVSTAGFHFIFTLTYAQLLSRSWSIYKQYTGGEPHRMACLLFYCVVPVIQVSQYDFIHTIMYTLISKQ